MNGRHLFLVDPAPVSSLERRRQLADIYAADRAKIRATDWAALHIRSDRSAPVSLPGLVKRSLRRLGGGIRQERGGFIEREF